MIRNPTKFENLRYPLNLVFIQTLLRFANKIFIIELIFDSMIFLTNSFILYAYCIVKTIII